MGASEQAEWSAREDRWVAEGLPGRVRAVLQLVCITRFTQDAGYEPHSCVDSRHRDVQFWQKQDGSENHRRVLYECDSRYGGSDCVRDWEDRRSPAASGARCENRSLYCLRELRGFASIGGIPDRILAAGGSKNQAPTT